MSSMESYFASKGYVIIKPLKLKENKKIYLMERKNKSLLVLRIYEEKIPAYEDIQGLKISNLPLVFSVLETEFGFVVEEEYINGLSLAEILEVSALNPSNAVEILKGLSIGVLNLHKRGFIHRDIKPENVMNSSSGQVYLIDLDATIEKNEEKTRDTVLLGTTGFAAPEQFGFGRSDERSDIFALGVLLNVMLTREHPSRVLYKGELQGAINKATEMNGDLRFQNINELLKALPTFSCLEEKCKDCGGISPGGGCIYCGTAPKMECTKKKKTPYIIAAAFLAVVLVLCAGRVWKNTANNETKADKQSLFQVHELSLELNDSITNIKINPQNQLKALEIAGEFKENYTLGETPFSYDSDGDGEKEVYYFAIASDFLGEPTSLVSDSFIPNPYGNERCIAPSIWKKGEDNKLTLAKELSDLIKNPKINVYSIGDVKKSPFISEANPLLGFLEGAIKLEYTYGNEGLWLYEACASINGKEITAYGKSEVREGF